LSWLQEGRDTCSGFAGQVIYWWFTALNRSF
jgi:hypothetical protein